MTVDKIVFHLFPVLAVVFIAYSILQSIATHFYLGPFASTEVKVFAFL